MNLWSLKMLQKGLESAKFDIRDIRGGFDTG